VCSAGGAVGAATRPEARRWAKSPRAAVDAATRREARRWANSRQDRHATPDVSLHLGPTGLADGLARKGPRYRAAVPGFAPRPPAGGLSGPPLRSRLGGAGGLGIVRRFATITPAPAEIRGPLGQNRWFTLHHPERKTKPPVCGTFFVRDARTRTRPATPHRLATIAAK
jgi:hypothetical protein